MPTLTPTPGAAHGATLDVCRDPMRLATTAIDAAGFVGQASGVLTPHSRAQLAQWLAQNPGLPLIAQGARTSLTGGATPDGDIVVDMSRLRGIVVDPCVRRVRVGPGLLVAELQKALSEHGLYYPPAPTHGGASIGGNVATNAAGAATFKYGTTRDWVTALELVLRDGQCLRLARGQVMLAPEARLILPDHPPDAELVGPSYVDPPLRKLAAGYHRRPPFDLLDLFIGSEGTLAFTTEIELRVIGKRPVLLGLIFVPAAEAHALAAMLRAAARDCWNAGSPGPDIRSIEFFDAACVALLAAEGTLQRHGLRPPATGQGCLLFEQELPAQAHQQPRAEDTLYELLTQLGLERHCQIAPPDRPQRQQALRASREAVPLLINERIAARRRADPTIHKAGGDMIVPFDRLPSFIAAYNTVFKDSGLSAYLFGHISDGNLHVNVLPRDATEMAGAERALLHLAELSIAFGGAPLSEHGVGRSPLKQRMLAMFRGPEALTQMHAIKRALDPDWTLARGVLFPPSVASLSGDSRRESTAATLV